MTRKSPTAQERRAEPRRHAGNRGQALAETGLVIVLLVFLVMGIVEVGFAFGRTNMIVNAARDGARFAATLDPDLRNSDGCITDDSTIISHVEDVLATVGFEGAVAVSQGCEGASIPTVTVTVTGALDMIFNFIGTTFDVDRSVTFQDEGRSGCDC